MRRAEVPQPGLVKGDRARKLLAVRKVDAGVEGPFSLVAVGQGDGEVLRENMGEVGVDQDVAIEKDGMPAGAAQVIQPGDGAR